MKYIPSERLDNRLWQKFYVHIGVGVGVNLILF